MSNCHICKRPLDQWDDPSTQDCGGDCLRCMADAGDPDCIEAMRVINASRWVYRRLPDGSIVPVDTHWNCRIEASPVIEPTQDFGITEQL